MKLSCLLLTVFLFHDGIYFTDAQDTQKNYTFAKECVSFSQPTDIVFLLDSSSSEGANGFKQQLTFVYNITKAYEIGPDKVQISIVTYSADHYNEFYLDDFDNKTKLLAAIPDIVYKPGDTQTDDGLNFVYHVSFLPEHGGRNDSNKLIILLTDGKSTDTNNTRRIATEIHSSNIRVIAIGIGSGVNAEEVKYISTDNSYHYANFSNLYEYVDVVTAETCFTPDLTCRDTPADILFLLGTTGNASVADFITQLEFVRNFSREFTIGPDAVQIAVTTFSNSTQPSFWFDTYTDSPDVLAHIQQVGLNVGETITQDAMRFVWQDAFTAEHGARNESRHILILITNGHSMDAAATAAEAKTVHNSDIFVIAIGIGSNINQTEMKEIATGTGDQNFFAVANYGVLSNIEVATERQTCEFEQVCSTRPTDLVFLVDTSSWVGEEQFEEELLFVGNLTSRLIIGPNNVRVGLLTFSNDVNLMFNLNEYSQKDELLEAIQKPQYRTGITFTEIALDFVGNNSFKPENGGRRNANKVLIVVTDGHFRRPQLTATAASDLHDAGIKVISVGFGNISNDHELNLHAVASGNEFVFSATDFDGLLNLENDVIDSACKTNVTECSSDLREIIFLLDSSTSEGSSNFKKQLDFVNNFVDGFEIGPYAAQVGVVTFSTVTLNRFYLNDYTSKAALKAAIESIPYSAGQTHTGAGLEFVRNESLSPAHGARPNAEKVLIVMTDGQSQQKQLTANQGILLRKEGVKVIAVGIGNNINTKELAVIASDDKHMFQVGSFDELDDFESKVQESVCAKMECPSLPADIMFILDSSASIIPDDFHEMLNFVINFVQKFDVGTSAVQFGVVTFSNDVYPQFDLGRYSDKASVADAIFKIPYKLGSTYTEKALEYVRTTSFSPSHGARTQAAHIAIVLTDGQSHSVTKTKEAARLLKASGVEVISVGIGNAVNPDELSNIATNISYVFSVATFDALDTIQKELIEATCLAQELATPAPTKTPICGREVKADVIFLLDSSNSEGRRTLKDEIQFLQRLVDVFPIGPDDFRFGVIMFATNVIMSYGLNDTSTESQFKNALFQVPYLGGLTYTDQALKLANTDGFTEAHGDRPDAQNIVIVVTDGESTQPARTLQEAEHLKQNNVDIIVVGTGDNVNMDELNNMAADPSNVITVHDITSLPDFAGQVQQTMCRVLAGGPGITETAGVSESAPAGWSTVTVSQLVLEQTTPGSSITQESTVSPVLSSAETSDMATGEPSSELPKVSESVTIETTETEPPSTTHEPVFIGVPVGR